MEGQHENEGQKNGKNENCPERGFSLFSVFSGHGKYKKKRHKKKKRPFKMPLERTDGAVARQNASKIYRNMGILPNDTQKDL
jgi:hypothetical protein